MEAQVNHVLLEGISDAVTLVELKECTSTNQELQLLSETIAKGCMDLKRYPNLCKYKHVFQTLSLSDGIITKGHKILVPEQLRARIIAAGHDGHQGMDKTKMLLRSKYWYPGIDKDIETFVSNCRGCQVSVNNTTREPLIMGELPNAPWQSVVTDYYGPLATGEHLIVTIDEYSRFPIVKITNSTSPKSAIPKYDEVFSEFGIPDRIRSDNGSPYNSNEFRDYCKYMGLEHKPIMPCYPQANGMVEKFNSNLTKVIMTSKVLKANWKQEMYKFLRNYRCTPHCTTGEAPADLMFNKRNFRTRLPEVPIKLNDESIRMKDRRNKERVKKYADRGSNVKTCPLGVGDSVLVTKPRKCKSAPYYDPRPYTITQRKGNMITAERDNHRITRNTSFFKYIENSGRSTDYDDEESDYSDSSELVCVDVPDNANETDVEPLRRSVRVTGQPVWYPMDVVT